MKKIVRSLIFLTLSPFSFACHNGHAQQYKQVKISQDALQKILKICFISEPQNILVYYFDGDCAFCCAKASYVEKYASLHQGLTPVLIAKTLNSAIFQDNLKKLRIQSCVHVERNKEFENTLTFMKVTKIDVHRNVEYYDEEIENN